MDFLTAVSVCSLHHDLTLVVAMAMSFSQGNPLMVKDAHADSEMAGFVADGPESDDSAALPMPEAPQTRQSAIEAIERVKKHGGSPLAGLLPVPPEWAAMFRRKPSELLNACTNLSIATAMLSEFEYQCGAKATRKCVLAAYTRAIGFQYFDTDVLDELTQRDLDGSEAVVDATDEVLQAPIMPQHNADDVSDGWGTRTLFFAVDNLDAPKPNVPKSRPSAAAPGKPPAPDPERETKKTPLSRSPADATRVHE